MVTRYTSIEEMKQLFFEMLFNHTDEVTKITNHSVLNGIAYGVAKVGQKANKEIALVESHLFPEYAFGEHLDTIAERRGVSSRFGSSKSSTYVRVVGVPGTVYTPSNIFKGDGVEFEPLSTTILNSQGYAYIRVQSTITGTRANVDPLTINSVSPAPPGHQFVTNEYQAQGGRNVEDDDLFKRRIRKSLNLFARNTLDYLTAVFQNLNNDVLYVTSHGLDELGRTILVVVMQNGILLTDDELTDLLEQASPFMNLSNYNYINSTTINVVLKNVEYEEIDLIFRADVILNQPIDLTRKELQISLSKYLDFRTWNPGDKVEWDDLLGIIKRHPMIRYVSDTNFSPNIDVDIPIRKLPRIRGFIMLNLDGELLIDNNSVLNPLYYPNNIDISFQQSVLNQQ